MNNGKHYFSKAEVVVKQRDFKRVEPAVIIKCENGKVTQVTVTADHNLHIDDVTGLWDIIGGEVVYIGKE